MGLFIRRNMSLLIIPVFYTVLFILNDSFVYKSLFFYYTFIIVTCLISAYFFVRISLERKTIKLSVSFPTIISLLMILFPFIHKLITGKGEWYLLLYFVSIFVLFVSLSANLSAQTIKEQTIMRLIIGFAFCESVVCLLQYFSVLKSGGNFFVSGSHINPNATAMFLAMTFPVILYELRKSNKRIKILFLSFLIILNLIAIYSLESRTGYIGSIVSILGYLFSSLLEKKDKKIIILCSGLLLIFITCLSLFILKSNAAKENSAKGRMFIWKVSVEMIKEAPLRGYGYGMTEGNITKRRQIIFRQSKPLLQNKEMLIL